MNVSEFDSAFGLAVGAAAMGVIWLSLERSKAGITPEKAETNVNFDSGASDPPKLYPVAELQDIIDQTSNRLAETMHIPALARHKNADVPNTINSPMAQITNHPTQHIVKLNDF